MCNLLFFEQQMNADEKHNLLECQTIYFSQSVNEDHSPKEDN